MEKRWIANRPETEGLYLCRHQDKAETEAVVRLYDSTVQGTLMVEISEGYAVALRADRFAQCEWSGPLDEATAIEPSDRPVFDPTFEAMILTDASPKRGILAAVVLDKDLDSLDNAASSFAPDSLGPTVAEASAIFLGLSMAKELRLERVIVWSDCQPLVAQLHGQAQVKAPAMQVAVREIQGIAGSFEAVEWLWFKRTAFLHYYLFRDLGTESYPGRDAEFPAKLAPLLQEPER